MNKKFNLVLLIVSTSSFFIASVMLTILRFTGQTMAERSALDFAFAIAFWIFLLIGIVGQIILSIQIKIWEKKYSQSQRLKDTLRPGIIAFFRSFPGILSDGAFLLALIIFIIAHIATDGTGIVCYICVSVMFLAFCLHCIFNGKNYYYIINRDTIEKIYKNKSQKRKLEESQ